METDQEFNGLDVQTVVALHRIAIFLPRFSRFEGIAENLAAVQHFVVILSLVNGN
jgi:hypothetical protein